MESVLSIITALAVLREVKFCYKDQLTSSQCIVHQKKILSPAYHEEPEDYKDSES